MLSLGTLTEFPGTLCLFPLASSAQHGGVNSVNWAEQLSVTEVGHKLGNVRFIAFLPS